MPDVALAPRPALVVIPNVPILEVGEDWPASTGPATFTPEDLAAAVAAQDDPAVRSPILKLGHVRAGQPAFGRLQNLRTDNNGMTLVADIVGAPAWLADVMPYAWPSRSIEGNRQVTTETGRTHLFVIDALALLGVELPAVSTLDEVAAVYTAASMEEAGVTLSPEVAAARGGTMPPSVSIAAALTTEDVRRAYYEQLGPGETWWWIREMQLDPLALIVDDDEGGLWRVPVTLDGDEPAFGESEAVRVEYVAAQAVAATSATSRDRRAIVFASRDESRGGLDEMPDLTSLRQRLGLGDDVADDEVIRQAAERLADPTPASPAADATQTPTGTPATPPAPTAVTPPTDPASPPAQVPTVNPDGTVIVDAGVWNDLLADVAAGRAAADTLARQAEDAFIARVRAARRLGPATNPASQRLEASLRREFQRNRGEAEAVAASLTPVPGLATVPTGHEDGGDPDVAAAGAWDSFVRQTFPGVAEVRATRDERGSR